MSNERPLILAYHAVSSTWRSSLATPLDVLRAQLESLAKRGYTGMTFTACERRRTAGELPPKVAVVTFDDGFKSVLAAKPVLDELGFPGTVFVVTQYVESGERLSWPGIERWLAGPDAHEMEPLGWADLELLTAAGWEIGSHTRSHRLLVALDDALLDEELTDSRQVLASHLDRCDSIAYPYGVADGRVVAAAARAGYVAGCTLMRLQPVADPYRRARIGLSGVDRGLRLRAQLSPRLLRMRTGRLPGALRRLHMRRSWMPRTESAAEISKIES
jgi:peptidoglycan/xylan/chitin deacetylase (PgdA/CDA1 family)